MATPEVMPKGLTTVLMADPAPTEVYWQQDMTILVHGRENRPAEAPPTVETTSHIHSGLSSCNERR